MKLVLQTIVVEAYNNSFEDNIKSLDSKIDEMVELLNELGSYWTGSAADSVRNNSINYVNKLKNVVGNCYSLNGELNSIIKTYQTVEKDFSEQLEKAVINHE